MNISQKGILSVSIIVQILCVFIFESFSSTPISSGMQKKYNEDLEKASQKLHEQALAHFDQEKYWESARDLIILMDFYPDYSKIDKVVYTLGDCLYEIGLYEGAGNIYKFLIKKYIRSPHLPNALLGLQRIQFDTKDYARCIEFYKAILRGSPSSDILDCSRYYAGQSYYYMKDYPRAIQVLSQISDTSPYYDYGIYNIGLSLLRMKRIRKAVETFRRLSHLPIVSDERRGIVDETHLTLGYIYYELGKYDLAYKEFQSVSSNHENYDQALLASGWAACQLNNYEDAVPALTDFITQYPENDNSEEAFFLLGRSYLKLERYDEALKVYEHLVDIFPDANTIPVILQDVSQSLAREELNIERIKMDLLVLESKLLEVLPLYSTDGLPENMQQEKGHITELREEFLKRIKKEREDFDQLTTQILRLKKLATMKEERRDWRAYAEYGKSRALFLKQKTTLE